MPHAADRENTIRAAIDAFLNEVQDRSPATTQATYGAVLNNFLAYLRASGIIPEKAGVQGLEPQTLMNYRSWLMREHFRNRNNPYTVGTYGAVLRSWIHFLIERKLAPGIASETVAIHKSLGEPRTKGRRLPRAVKDTITEKILETIARLSPPKSKRLRVVRTRDLAILQALRSTGARISELTGADVESLDPANKSLRVLGKGSKERLVYFDGPAWKALEEYIESRRGLGLVTQGKLTPLFAHHHRKKEGVIARLTPHGVRYALSRYTKLAGIDERVTPHRLRHAFGVRVLETTGDLAATQDLLGHASPATTRIYAPLVSSRLRAAHKKAFPR